MKKHYFDEIYILLWDFLGASISPKNLEKIGGSFVFSVGIIYTYIKTT